MTLKNSIVITDKINRDNSVVKSLNKVTLKSIEKLMLKNESYFKSRYDDAQHIYNIIKDKLEGENL